MSERSMVCVACPVGCSIVCEIGSAGDIVSVSGNRCKRGLAYATQEISCPTRTVTAVVPIKGALEPLSVKTASPIPKHLIFDVLSAIESLDLSAPVLCGEVLVENVCSTGISVVATKTVEA